MRPTSTRGKDHRGARPHRPPSTIAGRLVTTDRTAILANTPPRGKRVAKRIKRFAVIDLAIVGGQIAAVIFGERSGSISRPAVPGATYREPQVVELATSADRSVSSR
jgi:hypothetical protein